MKTQPIITVGILAEPEIRFLLCGKFRIGGKNVSEGDFLAQVFGTEIFIKNDSDQRFFGIELDMIPLEKTCFFELKDVTIGIAFHWEQKENQQFRGGLKLVIEEGKIRCINVIRLEEYLKSVISSEMSATSSPELLKAHAVISRSWLMAQIEKSKKQLAQKKAYQTSLLSENELIRWYDREDHQLFDVCADDHCQRYQGITKIISGKVLVAVEETSGEVLVSDGQICDARFSKCCGGVTESFENAWEAEHHSYLVKITDNPFDPADFDLNLQNESNAGKWIRNSPPAFCNTNDKKILSQVLPGFDQATTDFYRWKVEYSQTQLSELIKKRSGFDFGEILKLEPVHRGDSGRLIRLKITGTKKTLTVGKELEIRKWLSESHLYSSAFVADHLDIQDGIPQKIILTGAGWGHGVGLCQIGAAVMGEKGFSYKQILKHYFTGAGFKKLYP
jgi:stage II sporulation protein D